MWHFLWSQIFLRLSKFITAPIGVRVMLAHSQIRSTNEFEIDESCSEADRFGFNPSPFATCLDQSRWLVCNSIVFGILNDNLFLCLSSHRKTSASFAWRHLGVELPKSVSWIGAINIKGPKLVESRLELAQISRGCSTGKVTSGAVVSRANILRWLFALGWRQVRWVFSLNHHRLVINGESANCATQKALKLT